MACENLFSMVKGLEKYRNALQQELKGAAPNQKPPIVGEIKQLNKQIQEAKAELDACLKANGVEPLLATLSGTATLTTSDEAASGPFTEQVAIGLHFGPGRTTVKIVNFPSIVTDPFNTPLGTNITTVTLAAGGNGTHNPTSGVLTIALTLKFDQSIDIPFFEEDSTLSFALSTASIGAMQGSPVNQSSGAVTLVGSGTFAGGYLGGKTGRLTIAGVINPIP